MSEMPDKPLSLNDLFNIAGKPWRLVGFELIESKASKRKKLDPPEWDELRLRLIPEVETLPLFDNPKDSHHA